MKDVLGSQLPKGATASGLNYSINQEKYPWVFIDSVKGAEASEVIYSISETAKLNGLSTYHYFNHPLTELPRLIDQDGNVIHAEAMEALLPWAEELPDICRKPRR